MYMERGSQGIIGGRRRPKVAQQHLMNDMSVRFVLSRRLGDLCDEVHRWFLATGRHDAAENCLVALP